MIMMKYNFDLNVVSPVFKEIIEQCSNDKNPANHESICWFVFVILIIENLMNKPMNMWLQQPAVKSVHVLHSQPWAHRALI